VLALTLAFPLLGSWEEGAGSRALRGGAFGFSCGALLALLPVTLRGRAPAHFVHAVSVLASAAGAVLAGHLAQAYVEYAGLLLTSRTPPLSAALLVAKQSCARMATANVELYDLVSPAVLATVVASAVELRGGPIVGRVAASAISTAISIFALEKLAPPWRWEELEPDAHQGRWIVAALVVGAATPHLGLLGRLAARPGFRARWRRWRRLRAFS
jgi:hypothetical protein